MLNRPRDVDPSNPTYDLIGFLGSDLGLAVAARNSLRVLETTGRLGETIAAELPSPANVLKRLVSGFRRGARATSRRPGNGTAMAPGRVNLFHMNPPEVALFVPDWRGAANPDVRNVCVPFWELPVLPKSWEPVLCAMDVVMAPSRFVQSACAKAVAARRVVHYPQAAFLPEGIRAARDAWGLAPDRTVFALAFDFRSDIDRKNPWAAIEAFQAAFPGNEGVSLVVKTTGWDDPVFSGRAEELQTRIGSDRRIRVVNRTLAYADVLSLYASCDVLLSLHRSEGLGLHLMEAMSLGKVVVATNWSGNTDFMTEENSIPIGYQLVPLRTMHPTYGREMGRAGQVWAEADLHEAVRVLRRLHAERELRAAIGLAAERDMKARRQDVLSGSGFGALEAALAEVPFQGSALSRATLRTLVATAARETIKKSSALARRAWPRRDS